jgi:hypothetical protein
MVRNWPHKITYHCKEIFLALFPLLRVRSEASGAVCVPERLGDDLVALCSKGCGGWRMECGVSIMECMDGGMVMSEENSNREAWK